MSLQVNSSTPLIDPREPAHDEGHPPASGPVSNLFNGAVGVSLSDVDLNLHQGHSANVVINIDHHSKEPVSQHLPRSRTPPPHVQAQLSTTSRRSNVLYEEHMMLKGRGYPLWIPQANRRLPREYQKAGICIGDVGIFTPEGSFDFLFNILRSSEDPMQAPRLPERFEPLSPSLDLMDVRQYREFVPREYLASASIESSIVDLSSLEFDSRASEGAILTMPDGAYNTELSNIAQLRDYAAEHAESWYRYANGPRGRDVENGQIRVVIGHDKSTSWGMATFSNIPHPSNFHLRFCETCQGSHQYSWEHTGMAEVRVGPGSDDNDGLASPSDMPLRNQCLFVRTMNLTLADDVWEQLYPSKAAGQAVTSASAMGVVSTMLATPAAALAAVALFGPMVLFLLGGMAGGLSLAHTIRDEIQAGSPPEASTSARGGVLVGEPEIIRAVHPANVINKILLHLFPSAKMAISTDEDWRGALPENWKSLSISAFIGALRIRQNITYRNGIVYLEPAQTPRRPPYSAVLENVEAPSTVLEVPQLLDRPSLSTSEFNELTRRLLVAFLDDIRPSESPAYQQVSGGPLCRTNNHREVTMRDSHPLRRAIFASLHRLVTQQLRDHDYDELIHRYSGSPGSPSNFDRLIALVVSVIALHQRFRLRRRRVDLESLTKIFRNLVQFDLDIILQDRHDERPSAQARDARARSLDHIKIASPSTFVQKVQILGSFPSPCPRRMWKGAYIPRFVQPSNTITTLQRQYLIKALRSVIEPPRSTLRTKVSKILHSKRDRRDRDAEMDSVKMGEGVFAHFSLPLRSEGRQMSGRSRSPFTTKTPQKQIDHLKKPSKKYLEDIVDISPGRRTYWNRSTKLFSK